MGPRDVSGNTSLLVDWYWQSENQSFPGTDDLYLYSWLIVTKFKLFAIVILLTMCQAAFSVREDNCRLGRSQWLFIDSGSALVATYSSTLALLLLLRILALGFQGLLVGPNLLGIVYFLPPACPTMGRWLLSFRKWANSLSWGNLCARCKLSLRKVLYIVKL